MKKSIVLITLVGTSLSSAHADVPGNAALIVERTGPGAYEINWAAGRPVDIYVADKADAPAGERRQLVDDDEDGEAAINVAADKRPYFYVVPKDGKGQWVAERLLPLEGGRNFRDLGGYRAADGRSVVWGKVFRSGTMAGLTAHDIDYLGRLGIRTVCDFRTLQERREEPNKWAMAAGLDYWTRDYEMSGGDLTRLFKGNVSGEQARAAMIGMYRELPYEQAEAYKTMFRKMLNGELPLAFNCSAGKDRAGLAAALILTALGVPRQTVIADYELSNLYLPAAMQRDRALASPLLANVSGEVLKALLAADPAYLNAAFEEMTRRNGSPENYLRDVVGLADGDIVRLHDALLE